MALEIERKFLLHAIPAELPAYTYHILQFYTGEARFRLQTNVADGSTEYFRTVKTFIEVGVNQEDESNITAKEFFVEFPRAKKALTKTRRVYKHAGLKFELDTFPHKPDFYMMEVEGLKMGEEIPFPEYLRVYVVTEVTGDKKYNNSTIAIKIQKQDVSKEEITLRESL